MKALKFYAEWCGPCKGLSMIIAGAKEKIDVEIEDVDIDTCGSLSAEYHIRSVPAMVLLDDNGKEVKRKVGMMNEAQLLDFLKV
jgi:thioredoxin 1